MFRLSRRAQTLEIVSSLEITLIHGGMRPEKEIVVLKEILIRLSDFIPRGFNSVPRPLLLLEFH